MSMNKEKKHFITHITWVGIIVLSGLFVVAKAIDYATVARLSRAAEYFSDAPLRYHKMLHPIPAPFKFKDF